MAVIETERQILAALRELNTAVQNISASPGKVDLLPLFERLNILRDSLPKDADPNLLHYLHKHSYEKARLLLEGRDAENAVGACRH